MAAPLEQPFGQPGIRELIRTASRPLIVTDDLYRPTPVGNLMPVLLEYFREAGIPVEAVRVVVARGTHGEQPSELVRRKIGTEAAAPHQWRALH